ncbi:retrovirus-related pol polyprotein from transposon TNT 1-94 [Tanacetum coccineum]
MTTLAKFMIIAGADNRPPMLDKTMYDSWKSRMELYIENMENGRMILNSVENVPLIWPTVEENGVTKNYEELSAPEKLQADCDLKATNIVLQGLPLDVYAIVNHHKVAKEIWDKVKLLMQGASLSLQEREYKLYDEFDKFTHVKGETLYQYYWRFAQLINDMHIINMTMRLVQVNTKFPKCLPAEWSKFLTDVKLARDLHTTNYDQSYSYLQQHEAHANEIRLLHERYQDPLAFVANYNQTPSNLNNYHSQYTSPHHPTSSIPQNTYHSPPILTQSLTEFPQLDSGLDVPVFNQGDDPIECLNKAMAFMTVTDDLDAYDSDYDDISNAKAVLMANLSNYSSDVLSEIIVQDTNSSAQQDHMILLVIEQMSEQMINHVTNWDKANKETQSESLTAELERYKERQIDSLEQNLSNQIKEKESLVQTFTVFKNDSKEKENKYMEKEIDLEKKVKELTNIVYKVGQSAQTVHMLTNPQVFYDDTHKQALGYQNPFYLKKAQRIKPTLYDGSVISRQHDVIPVTDEEETLILEEVSRSKMLAKQNDPILIKQKINVSLINYVELNQLSTDFGKHFVPQQELSAEQAFWLQTSNPNTEPYDTSLVKIEAPSELPKVSMVNTSLKKLKYHLANFDILVKKRITPDAITEGSWGFEHTKAVFINEIILFLKTLKDIFNVFDKDLLNEITEVQTVFNQMEDVVQQCSIEKQCFEIHKKELFLDNDRLLHQIMSQDVMLTVINSTAVFGDSVNLDMKKSVICNKCLDLEAELVKRKNMVEQDVYTKLSNSQLQEKNTTVNKLRNHIKSLRKTDKKDKVKQDMDEIETLNIELQHSVAKSLSENELLHKEIKHLKKIYKDQFDSIKKTHVLSKEHNDSLIAQLNSKSFENADLKGQIQEKVFVTTTLQNELRRLIGKNVFDNAAIITNATTIALGMFKLNLEPLPRKLLNNREAYIDYLKHTQEYVDTLQEILEEANTTHPLDSVLVSACCPDCSLASGLWMLQAYDREPLSAHQLCFKISGYYLKVAFRKHTCHIHDLDGVDLLKGSRGSNLYTLSLENMMATSPICLLSKASKTKYWLWHRRLSHLNFDYITQLAKQGMVRWLPRLKFQKDHLCSACALGKSKKHSHKPKAKDFIQEKLYLLHMDLCEPMRIQSINGKKYILVIIDDYSQFT